MKARFVTNLNIETIRFLKVLSAKTDKPINAIIEELVDQLKDKKEGE